MEDLTHEHPGGVKMEIEGKPFYHIPLSQFCIDEGCESFLWDDYPGVGFWIQHGQNQEARHFFPNHVPDEYFAQPWALVRRDIFDWVVACHGYESGRVAKP